MLGDAMLMDELGAGSFQTAHGVEADQRLIFDEKNGTSREVHAFHHAFKSV